MTQVLITGATGFIGGHVAKAALREGWQVTGLRRDPHKTGHLTETALSWVQGNLNDPDSLRNAFQEQDLVFHAAGYYPPSGNPIPVEEQVRQAEAEISRVLGAAESAGIDRLVYTSSLSTVHRAGGTPPGWTDESDLYQAGSLPRNAYYEVKSAMEQAVLAAAAQGLDAVIVNPTAVFGPGDVNLATARVIQLIAQGKAWAVPEGIINVVDARDVADSQVAAGRHGQPGERYLLGGPNLSIQAFATLTAKLAGVSPPRVVIPTDVLKTAGRIGDLLPFLPPLPDHLRALTQKQRYNIHKAVDELGHTYRPIEKTIHDSITWLSEQGTL